MTVGEILRDESMTDEEHQQIINSIIGSWRLAGLELDANTVDDMWRIYNGSLTTEQAIKNLIEEIKAENPRHQ